MNLFDILTFDHWLNPIPSRLFFSRLRFGLIDKKLSSIATDELRQNLPKITGSMPRAGKGPVLFAVADADYFKRFANMFVSTAAVFSPESDVHIHVIGEQAKISDVKFDKLPKHFHLTFEDADFSQAKYQPRGRYCQCMRFVRLHEFVTQTGRDYFVFDIDGLFQKSFASLDLAPLKAAAFYCRLQYADPGLRVAAGMAYVSATPEALVMLYDATSQMLRHLNYSKEVEKTDQRCLSMAMANHPGIVKSLPNELFSFEPGQGYFYAAKGARKNDTLEGVYEALGISK